MQGFSKQFLVCLITDNNFKSIMRKKKRNKLLLKTIDLLIPNHAYTDGWMDVCVSVYMGLQGTQIDTSSVPCPPAKIGGDSLCSPRAQAPVGKLFFQFKARSFLAFPSFQTLPQFPGLRSEKIIWLEKLPSIQSSLGNRYCVNSDTHTDIENTTWTNECVHVCACVRVCVYSSNCKKGTIFLSILRYNVIRNISVQGRGLL